MKQRLFLYPAFVILALLAFQPAPGADDPDYRPDRLRDLPPPFPIHILPWFWWMGPEAPPAESDLRRWADTLDVPEYGFAPEPPLIGLPLEDDIWLAFEPAMAIVGVDPLLAVDSRKCNVTCGSGYFACCRWLNGKAWCRCLRNGSEDSSCQGGGEGATECGIEHGYEGPEAEHGNNEHTVNEHSANEGHSEQGVPDIAPCPCVPHEPCPGVPWSYRTWCDAVYDVAADACAEHGPPSQECLAAAMEAFHACVCSYTPDVGHTVQD